MSELVTNSQASYTLTPVNQFEVPKASPPKQIVLGYVPCLADELGKPFPVSRRQEILDIATHAESEFRIQALAWVENTTEHKGKLKNSLVPVFIVPNAEDIVSHMATYAGGNPRKAFMFIWDTDKRGKYRFAVVPDIQRILTFVHRAYPELKKQHPIPIAYHGFYYQIENPKIDHKRLMSATQEVGFSSSKEGKEIDSHGFILNSYRWPNVPNMYYYKDFFDYGWS